MLWDTWAALNWQEQKWHLILSITYMLFLNHYQINISTILIKSKRTRFDSKVIAMNDTFRTMIHLKENKELSATLFIADQTPQPNSGLLDYIFKSRNSNILGN